MTHLRLTERADADLTLSYRKDGFTHTITGKVHEVDLTHDVEYDTVYSDDFYSGSSLYQSSSKTTLTFIPGENGVQARYAKTLDFPVTYSATVQVPALTQKNINKARTQVGASEEAEFQVYEEEDGLFVYFEWSEGTDE